MATYSENRETLVAPAVLTQGLKVAWSSVWSGFLMAVGIFLILTVLGLAIGISSVDLGPGANADPRGLSIGAAVWSGLTLLIALFIGGMVATRSGMVHDRAAGVIEGALIWVLSILTLIYMAGSGIGLLSSSVFSTLGGVAQGAASVAKSVDTDLSALSRGDVDQVLARLRDDKTAQMVATATETSQEEARATLSGIAQRVEAARADPAQAAAEARRGVEKLAAKVGARVERAAVAAQPYATTALWSTLLAMVLAMLAAIGGALTGRAQAARRLGTVGPVMS